MIIYKIESRLDGKIYVGQTQRTLKERISEHMRGGRRRSYIDRAIKTHGIENFTVEVIEECSTVEELNEREIFWIRELNSRYPNGYNLTSGGNGRNVTDETRKKMSARSAVKNAVRCIERGLIFDSVTAAAKWLGLERGTIRTSCKNKTRTGGGYHWEYLPKENQLRKSNLKTFTFHSEQKLKHKSTLLIRSYLPNTSWSKFMVVRAVPFVVR